MNPKFLVWATEQVARLLTERGKCWRRSRCGETVFAFILHSSKFHSLRSPHWYYIVAVNILIAIWVLLFSLSSTFQVSPESSDVLP